MSSNLNDEDTFLDACQELTEDQNCIFDGEEVYEDTSENLNTNYQSSNIQKVPEFSEALLEAKECMIHFFENRFDTAFELTSKYEAGSLPHSHGQATLRFLSAVLTLEPPEIEKAKRSIDMDLALCSNKRKQTTVTETLSSFIWRPIYDEYTDEEVHAELMSAEAQCMSALLTFFSDPSIMQMFKGAYQITAANNAFKTCQDILNHKIRWQKEEHKKEFECGVRTGLGIFNLVISHLPAKLMKILALAGFTGDKKTGINELKIAITNKHSIRYEYCAATVLGYNLFMGNIFGFDPEGLQWAESLSKELLIAHPNSILFKFFSAKHDQVTGKPEEAVKKFNECLQIDCDWKQIHNICYWDLSWCYSLLGEWEKAANCAKLLSKQCKWSPATNMYQYAVFLHHLTEENKDRNDLKDEIDKAIREVPELKIRYAGKTIPPEKFATENSLKYINSGEQLVIPAYELFYVWNIFSHASRSKELINKIHDNIDRKLEEHRNDKDDVNKNLDNYCKIYLLKGVCLKFLGKFTEAIDCFNEIINNESRVSAGSYIPPHASLELGITYSKLEEFTEAKKWLDRATTNYSNYLIEALVHLRAHNAMKKINKQVN